MKPFSYYKKTSVSIPRKDDYMTIYYYKKGVMVGMKKQFDEDFQPPKNCVEEHVLDEVSFNAHMKQYQEENFRLQKEFREDLIAKYNMTGHPKANKIFDKAWELSSGNDLHDVDYYFMTLIELLEDNWKEKEFTTDQYVNDTLVLNNNKKKTIFNLMTS